MSVDVNQLISRRLPEHWVPQELRNVIENEMKEWLGMTTTEMHYLNLIREIQQKDSIELNPFNYLKFLKFALFVEEIQNELDLKNYDLFEQKIYLMDHDYLIMVESLEEEQPAIIIHSLIEVTNVRHRLPKRAHIMRVKKIFKNSILVHPEKPTEFNAEYSPNAKYDIKFIFNAYTFRCCHHALDFMNLFELTPCMFPTKAITKNEKYSENSLQWFNKHVYKNPEQRQAVINILNRSSHGLPYILYGPPGTGKTATLIEAVCQAYNNSINNVHQKILVCTTSNEVADNITKRLIKYFPQKEPPRIHRMYSYAKDPFTIDNEILDYSNCIVRIVNNEKIREIVMFNPDRLPQIVICTLCTSTRLLLLGMHVRYFSYVFIDEAGQAIEPDAIIPFTLLSSHRPEHKGRFHGQIVLAGDPQQLGPVIFSKIANKILGNSILERLLKFQPYRKDNNNMYNPRYITKLVRNYRSHKSLIQLSSEMFYDSALIPCADQSVCKFIGWSELPNLSFPMIFREVRGKETRGYSPSVYNEAEITAVLNYVDKLIGTKLDNVTIKAKDIGIVTPFTAQKLKIKAILKEDKLEDIEVGTVQLFQGKEKEVIIVTTVRSEIFSSKGKEHIGFLSDPQRFNVAITRAKSLLIVVGHPAALAIDDYWGRLIRYCDNNGAYSGYSFIIKYDTKGWKQKRKNKKQQRQLSGPFVQTVPRSKNESVDSKFEVVKNYQATNKDQDNTNDKMISQMQRLGLQSVNRVPRKPQKFKEANSNGNQAQSNSESCKLGNNNLLTNKCDPNVTERHVEKETLNNVDKKTFVHAESNSLQNTVPTTNNNRKKENKDISPRISSPENGASDESEYFSCSD